MRSAVNTLAGIAINNNLVLHFLLINISHSNKQFLLPKVPSAVSVIGSSHC